MESLKQKHYKALLYDEIEEYEEVIEFLSKEMDLSENSILLNNRGLAYWEIGRNDEALIDLEKALSIDPDHESIQYNIQALRKHIDDSK